MFVTSKRRFKAQFNMKTLLEILLVLVVYSQLYPYFLGNEDSVLNELIADSDPITAALLSLLPFVIVAMIIIGVFTYNAMSRRR